MKRKDIRLWIDALRSGDYKQSKSSLHGPSADGEMGFCCLGVAIDILLEGDWEKSLWSIGNGRAVYMFDGKLGLPSEDTLRKIELNESTSNKLASMNDEGMTFDEIADWIEENSDTLQEETGIGY